MKNWKVVENKSDEKNNDAKDYGIIIPEWNLEEIVLSPNVKNDIDDIISFCSNRQKIIEDWDLKKFLKGKGGTTAINFFGLPGTGKSIAAEALAHSIGKTLIKADYSEIMDNMLGGSEKKLSELFERAEKNNALLFFDEADGLLSKRHSGSKSSENTNQIKSHLLTLLDGSNIIIVFATNFFENYDKAFFRRILFHVEFEMPDMNQRIDLWKFHLSAKIPKSVSYEDLALETENLAGGDIKNIVLKLCIKLSANRIPIIDLSTMKQEVEKYRNSLAASQGNKKESSLANHNILNN
jgi:SpoVK/Ycf46/Vps4 family AAA+-type ATPase